MKPRNRKEREVMELSKKLPPINEKQKKWEKKGYEVVSPFDVTEQFEGIKETHGYYAECMGRCVEALLQCDGIIMCPDWFYSKGCRTEWNVAEIYGKKRMMDDSKYMGRMENGTEGEV